MIGGGCSTLPQTPSLVFVVRLVDSHSSNPQTGFCRDFVPQIRSMNKFISLILI